MEEQVNSTEKTEEISNIEMNSVNLDESSIDVPVSTAISRGITPTRRMPYRSQPSSSTTVTSDTSQFQISHQGWTMHSDSDEFQGKPYDIPESAFNRRVPFQNLELENFSSETSGCSSINQHRNISEEKAYHLLSHDNDSIVSLRNFYILYDEANLYHTLFMNGNDVNIEFLIENNSVETSHNRDDGIIPPPNDVEDLPEDSPCQHSEAETPEQPKGRLIL